MNSKNISTLPTLKKLNWIYLLHNIITAIENIIILNRLGTRMPNAREIIPKSLIKLITITNGELKIQIKLIVLSIKVLSNACKKELKTLESAPKLMAMT